MRVFSACMKIMKRRKMTFLIYLSVFAVLLLSIMFLIDSSVYGEFSAQKPNYALINRDVDSAIAAGLAQVLAEAGTEVELEDSKEAMMDAGFYQAVDCIFVIPEGYGKGFWEGEDISLQMWQWPSSQTGYYLSSAVERYLSLVRMYQEVGTMSEEEMSEAAVSSMEQETIVTVRNYTDISAIPQKIRLFQRFLAYIMLLLCISGVGIVFMPFKKPEIRMRNFCSPVRSSSFASGKFIYACVLGAGAWIFLNLMGIAAVFRDWMEIDTRLWGLYFVNSFAVMLAAVSLALLCSTFITGDTVMSFVTNIVALAMSFLGGAFVPLEFMSSGILKVAKFVPVYWYERNEGLISGMTGFAWENVKPVCEGILIQVGFAAAFLCVYLLVNKYEQKAEEAYGSVKTEIEQ